MSTRVRLLLLAMTVVCRPVLMTGQWTSNNGPVNGWSIRSVVAVSNDSGGTNLYAASQGGVYLSTDNGITWDSSSATLASTFGQCLAAALNGSSEDLFTGTESNGIFRSTDFGTSWTNTSAGLAGSDVNALAVAPRVPGGNNLWAGTWSGVSHSTDRGDSWTTVNTGLTNIGVLSMSVCDTMLFVGTYGGGIFRLTNSGGSWDSVNAGLTDKYVSAMAVGANGTSLFAGTSSGGVFLSTDFGESWITRNTGFPRSSYDTALYAQVNTFCVWGNNIFAGTDGEKVYLSTDGGGTWEDVNTGLTDSYINALAVSSGSATLFAATNNGIWRRPLAEMITAVGPSRTSLPSLISLSANYPNPFNPITAIRYNLPSTCLVSLRVYDLTGRMVDVLRAGAEEAGYRTAVWNAAGCASGVYVVRLKAISLADPAMSFTGIRKMILLK
ncbi:MAG TPA: T9SS type A sorting domain-containing protein [Bacteroidota bacterium]|nr:T9SS type A sorting domain-containing protein [Bacteroidota bacterium]